MQPYVEPGLKYIGESLRLSVVLSEAGLPVRGSIVRVRVETPSGQQFNVILRDNGASQDGEADDGEYGGVFTQTAEPGLYRLHFSADGQQGKMPYHREAERTKTLYDKRRPHTGQDPDDGGKPAGEGSHGRGDCCQKLLRALRRQEDLLRKLIDDKQS